MDITLEVKSNRFPDIGSGMSGRVRGVIEATIAAIEGDAKGRAPVDTGFLRSSITSHMESDTEGLVEVGADYARFVEEGTRHMAARPYLTPAAEARRGPFNDAMARVVES